VKAIIKKITKGKLMGQFRFILVANNEEPIAQSWTESYTTKQMAIKTIKKYFSNFKIIDLTK
jgi:uncharacterized protein YegP (UPF0339 family)